MITDQTDPSHASTVSSAAHVAADPSGSAPAAGPGSPARPPGQAAGDRDGRSQASQSSQVRTVRLRILRQDGPSAAPRWEEFAVPIERGLNVIACLQKIALNPTTVEGRETTPVVFDAGCLEEVCGACTMVINGRVRQSCSCLMDEHAPNDGDVMTLAPMSKFPVVRDLAVDRSRLFHALRRVRAWVPIDGTHHLGAGPHETPREQETRYVLSTCMSCGCCLEACPQYNLEPEESAWDTAFVGAHALSQARLFNAHATGRVLKPERLDALMGRGGVNDCGNAQNCVKACPKEIPLTESIAEIGRQTTVHALKRFFTGPA